MGIENQELQTVQKTAIHINNYAARLAFYIAKVKIFDPSCRNPKRQRGVSVASLVLARCASYITATRIIASRVKSGYNLIKSP